jgi:hypothetical protein
VAVPVIVAEMTPLPQAEVVGTEVEEPEGGMGLVRVRHLHPSMRQHQSGEEEVETIVVEQDYHYCSGPDGTRTSQEGRRH